MIVHTVLIVTDGELGAVATRVLQQEGYDVVTARHAGHAFLVALTRARIDFLISESRLDEMTGEALATRVRRYHPTAAQLVYGGRPRAAGPLTRWCVRSHERNCWTD